MAFETGTITNSHQLVDRIYGFLKAIGWQDISKIQSNPDSDGYDYAFKSSSSLGTRDVYIRIAAGLTDASRVNIGCVQEPAEDGYNGYVNGLAYQYFPPDGSGISGLSELGIFGPSLYVVGDDHIYHDINLWNSTSTSNRSRLLTTSVNVTTKVEGPAGFDGERYVYVTESSQGTIERLDLTTTTSLSTVANTANNGSSNAVYARDADGKPYWWMQTEESSDNDRYWIRYDIESNIWSWENGDKLDMPPWIVPPAQSLIKSSGFNVKGVTRRKNKVDGSPHYPWIYAAQGFGTTTMSMFNSGNLVWSSDLSPVPPFTLGSSSGGSTDRLPASMYITKEMSGYEYDRLYIFRGGNLSDFASISIDNDGYYQQGASWVTHDSTPYLQTYGHSPFFLDGTIYAIVGADDIDALYKWDIPSAPEDLGTWSLFKSGWLPQDFSLRGPVASVHNHLCNKVDISEDETNTYWLFGDLDRIVVVVKNADSKYTYMYTGLYEPFADPRVATVISEITSGEISIKVSEPSLFIVGGKYMIVDNTGASVVATSELAGSKNMAPSELFTVLDKTDNILTVSKLSNSYAIGSLVGEDPMPLMVRVANMERAQTLNNINKIDSSDFSDPPWQYYKLLPAVTDSFAATTDVEERSLGTFLHPITLIDEGDEYTGKELRGQLKGVFGAGVALAQEQDVPVGSKTYVSFTISNSGNAQRIVVGPK